MGEVASWLSGDGRHCLLIYKCQLEKAIREIVNGSWMAMHSIGTGQIKVLKRNTIICCWLKCETCVRTACRYFLYPSLHRKLHESRLANSVVRCSAARGQSNSVVFANILSSEHYVWIYIFLQLRKVIFILRRSFKHRIIYLTDMAIMCASTIYLCTVLHLMLQILLLLLIWSVQCFRHFMWQFFRCVNINLFKQVETEVLHLPVFSE